MERAEGLKNKQECPKQEVRDEDTFITPLA